MFYGDDDDADDDDAAADDDDEDDDDDDDDDEDEDDDDDDDDDNNGGDDQVVVLKSSPSMEQVVTDYIIRATILDVIGHRCHRCHMGGKNLELCELGVQREQMAGYSVIELRAGTLPCVSCRVRQHHALPGLFVPRFEQESRRGE